MTVAIHQPNFCPWRPYFQKMEQADIFVIMGHCQWEKNNYQNRFHHEGQWFTLAAEKGLRPIVEKQYIDAVRDWQRITRRFTNLNVFNDLISNDLFTTNADIIRRAAILLNIPTEIENDYPTNLTGSERLADICKTYGATKYLSGISGKTYLNMHYFKKAGIEVIFQDETQMDKRSLTQCL